jgi:hypothetical protein
MRHPFTDPNSSACFFTFCSTVFVSGASDQLPSS